MSQEERQEQDEWIPKTKLGRKVKEGEIGSIDEVLRSPLPLKESEVIDYFIDLEDEALDVNMVQRMTGSGRRVKFRCAVVVGNRNGYVGFAKAKRGEVGEGIEKAMRRAKLNLIKVPRGSGSWESRADRAHTVLMKSKGKAGSVEIELIPAPVGVGIAAGETAKTVLELAGIEDVWTRTKGTTRTTVNFAEATYQALKKTARARVPERAYEELEVVE